MTGVDLEPWQALLAQLGRDVELAGLEFDEAGYCSLGLDTGRVLHLHVDNDGLLLMTVLGEAPTGAGRLAVLEALLAANAFWAGTLGATLALDPTRQQVLLMRREPLDGLQQCGLREVIGQIIDASERWSGVLKADQEPPERAADPSSGPTDPLIRV